MEVPKASVIPLHENWKYLNICSDLINEEWPRSSTARLHSLESSCDNLPTSLVLILSEIENNHEMVIGHCKLSSLHKMPDGCFIESVVICMKYRGKGWGRHIMLEAEQYAKLKGKSVIYLSTSDKQEFYEKLGYSVCEPVSIYGGNGFEIKNNFISSFIANTIKTQSIQVPPPPPPPPKLNLHSAPKKVYMHKLLN